MTEQSMPNPIELYEAATKHTTSIIAGLKHEQKNDATPCTEWDIEAVLKHLFEGGVATAAAFSGNDPQPVPEGNHPAEIYRNVTATVLEALKTPGVLDKQLQTPMGEMPGAHFAFGAFMDSLVHGWDIAKASGQNTDLPAELVAVCSTMFSAEAIEGWRGGPFGPAIEVSDDASAQDKMIANFGRKP